MVPPLHVLAPAQHGGKALLKSVEGTSLIPSPDGLFGNTGAQSRSIDAGAGDSNGDKSSRRRPKRMERRQKALASMWQGDAMASGSGGYYMDKGKGKNHNKGNGKGKNKGGKSYGKDGGKDNGKAGKGSTK